MSKSEVCSNRCTKVSTWKCPDGKDARLLTAPAPPKPLRGFNIESIIGKDKWLEKSTVLKSRAGGKCEICKTITKKKKLKVCAFYDLDANSHTYTFNKYAVLCPLCYGGANFYDTITDYFQHPSKERTKQLLAIIKHCFQLISTRNKLFLEENRFCSLVSSLCEYKRIKNDVEKLIEMYDIELYQCKGPSAAWSSWKYVFEGEEYHSPYKSEQDWKDARDTCMVDGCSAVLVVKKDGYGNNSVYWDKEVVMNTKPTMSESSNNKKVKKRKKKNRKSQKQTRDPRIDKIIQGWFADDSLSQQEKDERKAKMETKRVQAKYDALARKYRPKRIAVETGDRTKGVLREKAKNVKYSVHYENLEKQTADNTAFGGGNDKELRESSKNWKTMTREQHKMRKNGMIFEK